MCSGSESSLIEGGAEGVSIGGHVAAMTPPTAELGGGANIVGGANVVGGASLEHPAQIQPNDTL